MKSFKFSWDYGDFKIRSMDSSNDKPPFIELLKRCEGNNGNSYYITLAYYKWDKEGGNMIFVGNRPFEEIAELDLTTIWKQLWLACKMFQDWWEKEHFDF